MNKPQATKTQTKQKPSTTAKYVKGKKKILVSELRKKGSPSSSRIQPRQEDKGIRTTNAKDSVARKGLRRENAEVKWWQALGSRLQGIIRDARNPMALLLDH